MRKWTKTWKSLSCIRVLCWDTCEELVIEQVQTTRRRALVRGR